MKNQFENYIEKVSMIEVKELLEYKTITKKNICDVCGKKLTTYIDKNSGSFDSIFVKVSGEYAVGLVKHHMSYFPEIIIYVHGGCHHKIHRTNKYPKLKPKIEDSAKFYNRELNIKTRRYK